MERVEKSHWLQLAIEWGEGGVAWNSVAPAPILTHASDWEGKLHPFILRILIIHFAYGRVATPAG